MIAKDRVITYSLLAHINDQTPGISDLGDILLPLVEHVLFKMFNSDVRQALISDLKEELDSLYHFDIPYSILIPILKKIEAYSSKNGSSKVTIHRDNSFIIHGIGLASVGDALAEQEANLGYIERLYARCIKEDTLQPQQKTTLYEFLDQHRTELSRYFSKREEFEGRKDFTLQATFVNAMRGIPKAFDILRSIYLGSIITTYLEMDVGEIRVKDVELLLDTNFIMGLIELHSEACLDTCTRVVQIGKKLGYTFSVMDVTVEESRGLLNRVSDGLHGSFFASSLQPYSIEAACARLGFGKTDLQRISEKLPNRLIKQYGIKVVKLKEAFMKAAIKSKIYKRMQKRKHNPSGAHHDGLALYYVQKKRGKSLRNFHEANCWFVGDSPYDRWKDLVKGHILSERIPASYLVNIMWMCNPRVYSKEISNTSLTKLVSSTLAKNLASPEVLYEIDNNIQKYAVKNISPEDLAAVAGCNACRTMGRLVELNEAAKKSSKEFCSRLRALAEIARKEVIERDLIIENTIAKLNVDLTDKEEEFSKALLNGEQEKLHLRKEIKKQRLAELKNIRELVMSLENVKTTLERKALSIVNIKLAFLIMFMALPPLGGFAMWIKLGWNAVEGWISLFIFLPALVSMIYFGVTKSSLNPKHMYEAVLAKTKTRILSKHGFNADNYNRQCTRLKELQKT